jgi:TRAP-type C4-dicarboxylate transport system permease small subunit
VGRRLRTGAELVGVAIFLAMFGAFLLQVFMRYVLNRPLGWTDELSLVLYVWGIFWAAALMTTERDHVALDVLYAVLPDRGKRTFAVAGTLLLGGLFVAALPGTADYVRFMARERTSVLGLRFDVVFAPFLLYVAAVVLRSLVRLWRLLGARWREEL